MIHIILQYYKLKLLFYILILFLYINHYSKVVKDARTFPLKNILTDRYFFYENKSISAYAVFLYTPIKKSMLVTVSIATNYFIIF